MPNDLSLPPRLPPLHLRATAGIVCVAVAGPDMLSQAAALVATHRFFEFRLDSLPDPVAALGPTRAFLAAHPGVTVIATCRRTAFGGDYSGTAQQQLRLLVQAAGAGCQLVDIEVETAEELGPAAMNELRAAGAAVILSWHDFQSTPELHPVYRRLAVLQPDFLKIVPWAETLADSLRLFDLLERHGSDGRLVAMSMGQKGVPTRVLGPRYGSAFTFAAPDSGSGTAPGQVPLGTLRDVYCIDRITPATAIYAVVGSPIGASLSPRMQNAAFAAAGLDAVYLPLETADPHELQQVARRLNIRGLSVTMPLKEAILPLLGSCSVAVQQMHACNTVVQQADGTWFGDNTDVAGIVDPLAQRTTLPGTRVLVLGAGGAARAATFGLRNCGADVYLLNRTESRAAELAQQAGAHVQPRETLAHTRFDVIINTTPYGMRGKDMAAPIASAEMNCGLFFDLVYNPLETPLINLARERGIPVIPGAAMFVAQGVRQFLLWTGMEAPAGAMLLTVNDALAAG